MSRPLQFLGKALNVSSKSVKFGGISVGFLVLVWLAIRIPAVINTHPRMSVEIQQAHKLFDYGIWRTHGAPLWSAATVGHVPNPQDFVYTHHPYPSFWVIAAIYAGLGGVGVLVVLLLMKLFGCVLLFKSLDANFNRGSAWFASLLYALAPVGILEDYGASCVALTSIVWPVGTWLLVGRKGQDGSSLRASPWICGAFAFVACQIDWLALTIIPAMLVLSVPKKTGATQQVVQFFSNSHTRAILIGAVSSLGLFCLQVVVFHPEVSGLLNWLAVKTGKVKVTSQGEAKWWLLLMVCLRLGAFVGIPLALGSLACLRSSSVFRNRLVLAALAHFATIALAIFLLPNYFFMERTVYAVLIFPAAVCTASALEREGRWLRWVLLGLSIPGVLLAFVLQAPEKVSPVSKQLALCIAQNSRSTDVILTNLRPGESPYSVGDVMGAKATGILSDRRIIFSITELEQVSPVEELMKRRDFSIVFFVASSKPVSEGLKSLLESRSEQITRIQLALPVSAPSVIERLRAYAWYDVMRKADRPPPQATANSESFTVYRTECRFLRPAAP